jgi:hypothetical protein
MAAPTVPASEIQMTLVTGVSAQITDWDNGDGSFRIAFMTAGSSGAPAPVDLTTYTPSAAFESGTQIGSTGWYAVPTLTPITGLTAATAYRVMIVEYNGGVGAQQYLTDTASGNPLNFSTDTVPTLTLAGPAGSIAATSATLSGTITDDGGAIVTSQGLVYATHSDPTGSDSYVDCVGTLLPTFSLTLTNLVPGTLYYVRARASNALGTGYSPNVTFIANSSASQAFTDNAGGAPVNGWRYEGQPQSQWPNWLQGSIIGSNPFVVKTPDGPVRMIVGEWYYEQQGGVIRGATETGFSSKFTVTG